MILSTEEEKKLLATLLGKLHVSPGSSEDRLREAYTEVSEAVEDGLLTDATSRNALYKLHVSLGKIVNTLDEQKPAIRANRSSVVSSVAESNQYDDKTAISDVSKVEEEEEGDATVTAILKKEPVDDESMADEVTDVGNDTTAVSRD